MLSDISTHKEDATFINTTWTGCNCYPSYCRCHRPKWWCSQCCCYVWSPHYHPLPYCPPAPWYDRDEALREEGRRQERERQREPWRVDITPALPKRGC